MLLGVFKGLIQGFMRIFRLLSDLVILVPSTQVHGLTADLFCEWIILQEKIGDIRPAQM